MSTVINDVLSAPDEALLSANTLAEFNELLDLFCKSIPHHKFPEMKLSLGEPLHPLQKKILDLTIAQEDEELRAKLKVKPPKAKKEKIAPVELTTDGIVMYTDAGVKPNPGYGGWGMHGYIYSNQQAKKGSGNTAVFLTDDGYVLKSEADDKPFEVTPLKYIDGLGSVPNCSNNGGEVIAVKEGLLYAANYDIKKLTIFTDSDYAVKGSTQYLKAWERNGWVKSDGGYLPNNEHWKGLNEALNALHGKNVEVDIRWVRGHGTNFGNIIVDRYATMGREASTAGEFVAQIDSTVHEGYWSSEDRHPFIHHKCTYMTTDPVFNVPGEYYFGDHGKDDELIGKRQADTSYAYVVLKTPEPQIETVRKKMLAVSDSTDKLAFVSLDSLFKLNISRDMERFHAFTMFKPNVNRIDLMYIAGDGVKEPILTEIYPPRISIRALEAVNVLKGLLLDWQNNKDTKIVSTDITSLIYEKTAKEEHKIRPEFGPGFTTLKISACYASDVPAELTQTELALVLGVDLPERNALKRLEKHKPVVTLITWREATAIRWATIVKTDDGIGIWAGYYANTKYLKS